MKFRTLFPLFILFFAMFTYSCKKDEIINVTGITLDSTTLELSEQTSAQLVATLEPAGAEGTITWSSSDPSIAAVNNGVVTAIKEGTATVVAAYGAFSASCEVTVTPYQIDPNDLPASLKGTNYHLIHIDELSYEYIKDDIDNDFRVDDLNTFLYVWDNTFLGETSSGSNFYGQTEDWISLSVTNIGWSGAGYNVSAGFGDIDMTDMYANPEDYVFHMGLKSAQPSSSYLFIFTDGNAEAKICIGSGNFVDGDITYVPYTDFARDNEWHEIEIPLTKLNELGVFYNETFQDVNILAFLAGGIQGTTLDMDAIFFYKKPTE